MSVLQIVLLIAGIAVFIISFLLPSKKEKQDPAEAQRTEEELHALVEKEFETVKSHMEDTAEEAGRYAVEKAERALERLSNEKIMAVSEYSDTVLQDIHKNHEEVVFLYDMLNNKQQSLKQTVAEVDEVAKAAKAAADMAITAAVNAADAAANVEHLTNTVTGAGASDTETGAEEKEQMTKKPQARKATTNASASKNVPSQRSFDAMKEKVQSLEPLSGAGSTGQQRERRASASAQEAADGNRNEEVLKLFKQGMPEVEIAKQLGLGVGEVNVVLGLFN